MKHKIAAAMIALITILTLISSDNYGLLPNINDADFEPPQPKTRQIPPIRDITVQEGGLVQISPRDLPGEIVFTSPLNSSGQWQTKAGDYGIYETSVYVKQGNFTYDTAFHIIVLKNRSQKQQQQDVGGLNPGNLLWFFDRLAEDIRLFSTYDKKKAIDLVLDQLDERNLELKDLLMDNNIESAVRIAKSHERALNRLLELIQAVRFADSTKELEYMLQIQSALQQHTEELKLIRQGLAPAVESEETFESLMDKMMADAQTAKAHIDERKDKAIIKIKAKNGYKDKEIEDLIDQIVQKSVQQNWYQPQITARIRDGYTLVKIEEDERTDIFAVRQTDVVRIIREIQNMTGMDAYYIARNINITGEKSYGLTEDRTVYVPTLGSVYITNIISD